MATPHPSRDARHLPLKGKALVTSAQKNGGSKPPPYGVNVYCVRSNLISVCHPERAIFNCESNFCEVRRKRAKAQGEAAAGSIMKFRCLFLTNVTFIQKRKQDLLRDPFVALLLGLLRSLHSTTQTSTPLRSAQDGTQRLDSNHRRAHYVNL